MLENIDNFLMWESTTKIECQRIHHGRGGTLPRHVNIDWYPPHLLVTLYRKDDEFLEEIKKSSYLSVFVQHRYLGKSPWSLLKGEKVEKHIALESDLKYHLNFFKDQNIGFFMDMRNGRSFVRQHCQGKRLLNLFSYSCSFSVAALAGGAHSVINVDVNSALLNIGRENHRSNDQDLSKVSFLKLNILKSWGRLKRMGPYDMIIIDPPSYQKDRFDIQKNYATVARRVREMVADEAIIVACLNAPYLKSEFLKELFGDCKLIEELSSPPDFVEPNQQRGLKICAFQTPLCHS